MDRFAAVFCGAVLIATAVLVLTPVAPPAAAQLTWVVEVVDASGYAGDQNSISIDTLNRVHISYTAVLAGTPRMALRYAFRNDSGWLIETVSTALCAFYGTSIAVDSHDRPWIAYAVGYDEFCDYWNIEIAHWNGTEWETLCVDPPGVQASFYPKLALDSNDRPHVVYHNDTRNTAANKKLVYAAWNGTWSYETILVTGYPGGAAIPGDISMKLDSAEKPHIAYMDAGGVLRYIHWNGTQWVYDVVDAGSLDTQRVSIDIDSHDLPHISYADDSAGDLEYAYWNGTAWNIETPDSSGYVGCGSSIVLDSRDAIHISYGHCGGLAPPSFSLYYAHKSAAGAWETEIADSEEKAYDTSMTLDSHEMPHISYVRGNKSADPMTYELKYAHAPVELNDIPVSRVLPIHPYWNGNPIEANATDHSGVANVTLVYTYSNDNSSWTFWRDYATDTSPPWSWDFTYPDGEGYYQFYSFAHDVTGNVEPLRGAADAIAGYDITPPISMAIPVSPYWHTLPLITVDATATDNLSGVADVTLLYSHAPIGNTSWSAWTLFGTRTSPPWSWSFPFPDGKGNYKFHTTATDVAGNMESAKTVAEAVAGYNGTPPVTIPDYSPIFEQPISPIKVGLSSPIPLSLAVHNGGNATATANTMLAFCNSTPPATPFRTFTVNPIVPGGNSSRFTATWTSPAIPGTYLVSADVDYWNNVIEWNETNNVFTWTIDVVTGPITSLVIGSPNYTTPALTTHVRSITPLDLSVLDQSGLGIRNITYRIDGGSPVNYTATGTFFLSGEGVHTVEWWSLDWAGNLEEFSAMNLTVDDTPPATTIHQSGEKVTTATLFTLTATDSGCGVNATRYRIDGGQWADYAGGFTLTEGEHNVSHYSNDMLNNTEVERWLVVTVEGTTTPPEVTVNYKPLVALIFAIILLVAGVWSSRRRPWKGGKGRMAVVRAFSLTTLPSVIAEALTGLLSLVFDPLRIPPLLGWGTGVDCTMLSVGLILLVARHIWKKDAGMKHALD